MSALEFWHLLWVQWPGVCVQEEREGRINKKNKHGQRGETVLRCAASNGALRLISNEPVAQRV
jgi:hypothetical protein